MHTKKYKIVGLGEILWDLFPGGKQLGGAPTNFAYITSLLGDEGIPASRLGQDELGREAERHMKAMGFTTEFLQEDAEHPTGRVKVHVDQSGQPRFEISESVAWDFLEWTPQWQQLSAEADAVCFQSLSQRSPLSRSTIQSFIKTTRPQCLRVFDVNLRQHFYSADVLSGSMKLASIVKLNHEELPRIMQLLSIEHDSEEASARRLLDLFNLRLICITRGDKGSLLMSADGSDVHGGCLVKVVDTVGAGDAFTAALVHEHLRGASLKRMNEVANRMGAWVASQTGGTPAPGPGGIEAILAGIH
jgi:fructokinase